MSIPKRLTKDGNPFWKIDRKCLPLQAFFIFVFAATDTKVEGLNQQLFIPSTFGRGSASLYYFVDDKRIFQGDHFETLGSVRGSDLTGFPITG
jgi:hypothetical protein